MEINNFEKLVKVVTKNILEKIDTKTTSKIIEKSCLILVPNIGLGSEDYLEYIVKHYPDYDLYLGSSEEFSKIDFIDKHNIKFIKYDVNDIEFVKLLDQVETIIIFGLKINQMKALSLINDSEDINHIILSRLMANKSINIMINTNGHMYKKIADIVNDTRDMGISVTNIQHSNSTYEMVDLITESYVDSLKEDGIKVLVLGKNQLITPLAKDKLREFKIKIEYNEEAK